MAIVDGECCHKGLLALRADHDRVDAAFIQPMANLAATRVSSGNKSQHGVGATTMLSAYLRNRTAAMAAEQSLSSGEGWWRRPAGGREVLIVAFPLVLSTMSWTVLTFIDRMFLNWQSGAAMSASFSGGMIWFAVFCLPM